jgi:hypothetical protein
MFASVVQTFMVPLWGDVISLQHRANVSTHALAAYMSAKAPHIGSV